MEGTSPTGLSVVSDSLVSQSSRSLSLSPSPVQPVRGRRGDARSGTQKVVTMAPVIPTSKATQRQSSPAGIRVKHPIEEEIDTDTART